MAHSYLELNDTDSPMYTSKKPGKLILRSVEAQTVTEPLLLGQPLAQINEQAPQSTRRRHNKQRCHSSSSGSKDDLAGELERVLSKQFSPLIEALLKTIETNERRLGERRTIELVQDEWSDVAMIADHILCYFFCVLTLASCFLIFFNSPHVLAEW